MSNIVPFFKSLQARIIQGFESLEPSCRFLIKEWPYKEKGGGRMAVLRGDVFEKAAVNFSEVSGDEYPLNTKQGKFYATGVSLITHMMNPHMPTVHMNVRYLKVGDKEWFGGGYDLTPMGFPCEEDTLYFHSIAQKSLIGFPGLYESFSQRAKEYFYIPHWKKERGVGGIFFDEYSSGNFEKDFAMVQSVADHFLEAILPLYQKRLLQSWTLEEKEIQQKLRAHYVEFNLLYDRGTKFGFNSNGNPEAILCSMPPCAKW